MAKGSIQSTKGALPFLGGIQGACPPSLPLEKFLRNSLKRCILKRFKFIISHYKCIYSLFVFCTISFVWFDEHFSHDRLNDLLWWNLTWIYQQVEIFIEFFTEAIALVASNVATVVLYRSSRSVFRIPTQEKPI